MFKYLIIAGESSGDLHASHLMHEIHKINPNVSFDGIGGPMMEKEGLTSLADINKMAVMGFWEVLKNFRFLKSVETSVINTVKKIDAVILIDYPGFNLRIAKKIKKINPDIPIFYYISPQLWAWKEERIQVVKKYIDKMIVFFDFEYTWYKERGVEVDCVGHPFLDIYSNFSKERALKDLNLSPDKKYLTLFPGSRKQEIDNHLPYMLQALNNSFFDDFEILLGQANTLKENIGDYYNLDKINVIKSAPEKALAVADFAWVGSGTSTLEAVLLNVPFVLVYKTSAFSWRLMKKFVKVDYAGMPNIIINKMLIPELLQENFTSNNLISETKKFFRDDAYQHTLFQGYDKIKNKLGEKGASVRAATIIESSFQK